MAVRGAYKSGAYTASQVVDGLDEAMKKLRESMAGIVVRTAGFRSEHTEAARRIADLSVALIDASVLTE